MMQSIIKSSSIAKSFSIGVRSFSSATNSKSAILRSDTIDRLDYNHRYLPNTKETRAAMLDTIGVSSINDLFHDIPEQVRLTERLSLPPPQTEHEVLRDMNAYSEANLSAIDGPFFCGAGLYNHQTSALVDAMIQRGEYLTAYTPYQAEVSQGTLQTMFEFQTQVARMTGMEVSNASMYDGGTSLGECVLFSHRLNRNKKTKTIMHGSVHKHYIDYSKTLARHNGKFEIVEMEPDLTGDSFDSLIRSIDDDTSAVVVQSPSVFGHVHDLTELSRVCQDRKVHLIQAITEVVSLGALKRPGDMGVDIVAAEGQSIGLPMNFGGPTVGLLACRSKYMRQMPGRIVGETTDSDGERAYVLTLGTREQHIRREKATSNICTAGGLCALAFSIQTTLLGETGLRTMAAANHSKAVHLADAIEKETSASIVNETFFNEFTVKLPTGISASKMVEDLATNDKILAGVPVSRLYGDKFPDEYLLVAATEANTDSDLTSLVDAIKKYTS